MFTGTPEPEDPRPELGPVRVLGPRVKRLHRKWEGSGSNALGPGTD